MSDDLSDIGRFVAAIPVTPRRGSVPRLDPDLNGEIIGIAITEHGVARQIFLWDDGEPMVLLNHYGDEKFEPE